MTVAAVHHGKIGPNSVIQTLAALKEIYDPSQSYAILACAGAADLADRLPAEMIDEQEFHTLALALVAQLGPAEASQILRRAGQLTAVYLLRNRIPRPAQWLLRVLPARQSLGFLLRAVARHAWTFAGSAEFSFSADGPPWVQIASPALRARPELAGAVCSFYKGTFEHLIRALIDRRMTVWESECQAHGGGACTYRFV